MFPRRYYPGRMFAPRYFPESQGLPAVPVVEFVPTVTRVVTIQRLVEESVRITREVLEP